MTTTPTTPDAALTAYTERLLVGTSHTTTTALAAADGTGPATGAAGAALRDGWAAAGEAGERS